MNAGKALPQGPMAEVDIERLETLLWERAVPNGGMPLEMLDGYFSALVCGPDLVLPSEYNRLIWGDPPPVWESIDEGSESFYLVQAYWNHIADRIGRDPDAEPDAVTPAIMMPDSLLAHVEAIVESGEIPPLLSEEDADFPLASGWAVGFFLGVELREDAWDAWAEAHEHVAEHLDDIQLLMMLPPGADDDVDDLDEQAAADALSLVDEEQDEEALDDDELGDEDDEAPEAPTLIERLDIMFELPHMLRAFDVLRRSEQIRARGPARREAAPARNDPCPCGSGKKYKKCHGDPARLH